MAKTSGAIMLKGLELAYYFLECLNVWNITSEMFEMLQEIFHSYCLDFEYF